MSTQELSLTGLMSKTASEIALNLPAPTHFMPLPSPPKEPSGNS